MNNRFEGDMNKEVLKKGRVQRNEDCSPSAARAKMSPYWATINLLTVSQFK